MRTVLSLLAVAVFMCLVALDAHAADKPDILEVMKIDGVIDESMANRVKTQVEEINDNQRIKAVLLIVDSPGGGVLASSNIYEELAKLKVPVVGWCDQLCASGGMYALMSPSVKYIGVRTSTISGSIGVISENIKYNRLLDWARIDVTVFRSGKFKQAGNPNIPMGEEEKAHLQAMIDLLASRFYDIVVKGRPKLTAEQLTDIKTAKVFFGVDGVKSGLVDEVMTYDQATKKAKELSGSKLIYTRDEIKKMSRAGDKDDHSSELVESAPKMSAFDTLLMQVNWLFEVAREIKAGNSLRAEYRLDWKF